MPGAHSALPTRAMCLKRDAFLCRELPRPARQSRRAAGLSRQRCRIAEEYTFLLHDVPKEDGMYWEAVNECIVTRGAGTAATGASAGNPFPGIHECAVFTGNSLTPWGLIPTLSGRSKTSAVCVYDQGRPEGQLSVRHVCGSAS